MFSSNSNFFLKLYVVVVGNYNLGFKEKRICFLWSKLNNDYFLVLLFVMLVFML